MAKPFEKKRKKSPGIARRRVRYLKLAEGMGLIPNLLHLKYLIYCCFGFEKMLAFGLVHKHPPEPVPPDTNPLVTSTNTSPVQQVLRVVAQKGHSSPALWSRS